MNIKFFLLIFSLFIYSHGPYGKTVDILFVGDSLSQGYGVAKKEAFPHLVMSELKKIYPKLSSLNGSVSGSTSASAVSRLKWFAKMSPKVLFLALGANDALRGVQVSKTYHHLSEAIIFAQKRGWKVVLGGMQAPPNYGVPYQKEFNGMYEKLAAKYQVLLVPFILEGVAGEKALNQSDGIHPNSSGHKIMAKTILPYLKDAYEKSIAKSQ